MPIRGCMYIGTCSVWSQATTTMLSIMQDKMKWMGSRADGGMHQVAYAGSICAPTCAPIASLSARESLVLTNALRLLSLVFDTLKTKTTGKLDICGLDTVYEYLEYAPSSKNDEENPLYIALCEALALAEK